MVFKVVTAHPTAGHTNVSSSILDGLASSRGLDVDIAAKVFSQLHKEQLNFDKKITLLISAVRLHFKGFNTTSAPHLSNKVQ